MAKLLGRTARIEARSQRGQPAWQRLFMPSYQGAKVTAVRHRSCSGISAYVKELDCEGPFRADFRSDCSRLLVMLEEVGGLTEARDSQNRPAQLVENSGHSMTFAPAQSPIWAHSDRTRYMRHITFSFQDEAVASLLDEDVHPTRAFMPRFNFFDARLLHLARLFEIECASDELTDTLYGDGLAVALLLRLASFDGPRRQPPARGGLTSHQLRQVTEYLAEHLADSIHLQDLAGITQLSRSHFSRAFRVSTGMPPHQWLLQERVRRAKEQLRARRLSVSEIALVTGFADQAHFTRTFRRVVGASPAAWRRNLGP